MIKKRVINLAKIKTKTEPEIKKKPKSKKHVSVPYTDNDMILAQEWAAWAYRQQPWREPDVKVYAVSIRKIRESIKATDEGMRLVFKFISTDKFWAKNSISPRGLHLDRKSKPPKIDYILSAMKQKMLTPTSFYIGSDFDPLKC